MAFWTLDSIFGVETVTAGFTEGVTANDEEPWYGKAVVELPLAVRANHPL